MESLHASVRTFGLGVYADGDREAFDHLWRGSRPLSFSGLRPSVALSVAIGVFFAFGSGKTERDRRKSTYSAERSNE